MKLINKKTGQEGNFIINKDHFECVDLDCVPPYFSLSELLDEWEDYKPKEPLIKDQKIRKAVRAWADANGFLNEIEVHSLTAGTRFSIENYDIEFLGYFIYDLEDNKTYTIAELCERRKNDTSEQKD